ncbi:hypothetical protein CK505_12550 [Kocuria sp. WN036]|uniref:hypothetical protein n=1 Tax=Kocuria sp. WN036 TaxID=2032628 RepID=UPI000BAB3F76|nr:hypothetical protein [Kocuria sp. WN036]PAU90103.1 hypothetical protein CK505_12550 [Kocuria sp. WN036]
MIPNPDPRFRALYLDTYTGDDLDGDVAHAFTAEPVLAWSETGEPLVYDPEAGKLVPADQAEHKEAGHVSKFLTVRGPERTYYTIRRAPEDAALSEAIVSEGLDGLMENLRSTDAEKVLAERLEWHRADRAARRQLDEEEKQAWLADGPNEEHARL